MWQNARNEHGEFTPEADTLAALHIMLHVKPAALAKSSFAFVWAGELE